MICCSSGKARVYYNIPTQGGLKYKLKNSTKWIKIAANEELTHQCIDFSGTKLEWNCPLESGGGGQIGSYIHPAQIKRIGLLGGGQVTNWIIICQTVSEPIQSINIHSTCPRFGNPPQNIRFTENVKYKFTVTGTETGTKYLEIEVDECPDVQTIPCKFDPAKEQYFDVELGNFDASILRKIPGFPEFLPTKLRNCIEIVTHENAILIKKVGQMGYKSGGQDIWIPTLLDQPIRQIESPKGCPAPKVRVECCPNGICGEDKKCPKGTTCELICNGFKCCYSKGVLIRSIKL